MSKYQNHSEFIQTWINEKTKDLGDLTVECSDFFTNEMATSN